MQAARNRTSAATNRANAAGKPRICCFTLNSRIARSNSQYVCISPLRTTGGSNAGAEAWTFSTLYALRVREICIPRAFSETLQLQYARTHVPLR